MAWGWLGLIATAHCDCFRFTLPRISAESHLHMSQGLVSVILASGGNDMTVIMVVATK